METDGVRHIAKWLESREKVDEEDARLHPEAQPPGEGDAHEFYLGGCS